MKRWMFIALLVFGLLAFAAIIWFGTPFIAFAGSAPFEPIWVRVLIIGVVWLGIGGFYLFRFLRARAAAKRLEAGMLAGAGSDEKVLAERMGEALATLKSAAGKLGTIYSLPWYIIIGPPGAGKT
ncbi:MAG TPA: type VI secretion system membrane subunit TssM, partial [Devosia sp.]|nr:type VI secretion system membrane subunit TssM [Devosia sp.]